MRPPNPLVPFEPAAKGAPRLAKLLDDPGAGVCTSVEAALRQLVVDPEDIKDGP